MQSKLIQFIDGLSLDQNDKDYLKLLIKEERESLLENVVDYVHEKQKELGELQITNDKLDDDIVGAGLKPAHPGDPNVGAGLAPAQGVDTEVDNLDKALDYGDEVYDKAEETYDKVILSLKKNDKWLSKLIIKVQKSNEGIKDKFVKLLQDARGSLGGIRASMDGWWTEFDQKKYEADHTLGAQVASIKSEFAGGDHELEESIVEFVEKLCSQYHDKIDNMSKAFSNNLDTAAKQIDNLTNETSDKMRDIINEREQVKLRNKIMGK